MVKKTNDMTPVERENPSAVPQNRTQQKEGGRDHGQRPRASLVASKQDRERPRGTECLEKIGLIPHRTAGGVHRLADPAVFDLRHARRGQGLGAASRGSTPPSGL